MALSKIHNTQKGDLVVIESHREKPLTRPVDKRSMTTISVQEKQFHTITGEPFNHAAQGYTVRPATEDEVTAYHQAIDDAKQASEERKAFGDREDVKLAEKILSKDAATIIKVGITELRRFANKLDAVQAS